MSDRGPEPSRQRTLGLAGMTVRQVTVGEQNDLRMELGTTGNAVLFTTLGSVWRWENQERMLAATGDDHASLVAAIAALVGRTVTTFRTQRPSTALWLAFDDDSNLLVFPVTTDAWDHWALHYPDGWVFSAGPGTEAGWDPPPDGTEDSGPG